MRRILALVFALYGCSSGAEPEHDAKVPGTLLGTFDVTARISVDECGRDLLAAPDPWVFPVRLSRFQDDLYWLNGTEAIVGELNEKQQTFGFSTRVDVPITPRVGAALGCTVSRYDRADGTVALAEEVVTGLEGTLEFEYRTKSGSECFEIIGVPGGFNTLPCVLRYRMVAKLAP